MKAVIVAFVPVLVLTACSSGAGTTAQPSPSTLAPTTTPATTTTSAPAPGGATTGTTTTATSGTTAATTTRAPSPTPARTASPAARRTASATASAKPSPTRSPRTYAIDMVTRSRFSPDALTLRAGDAVLVTNRDLVPHDFTIHELGIESGEMNQGSTFRRTLAATGTYTFVCTRHTNMDGTLTVTR